MALAKLVALTSFTSPLTTDANAVTAQANLLINIAALSALSWQQLKALQEYFGRQELMAESGTDYTGTGGSETLLNDSACLFGGLPTGGPPNKNMEAMRTAIAYNYAKVALNANAKTAMSTDIETLLGLVPVTQRRPEDTLDRMLACLQYQLSILV